MDMFAEIKSLVLSAIERLVAEGRLPRGLDLGGVTVEPPRDPAHGDMATNAAMVLSRPARKGPREIAEACADHVVARDIDLIIHGTTATTNAGRATTGRRATNVTATT